MVVVIVGGIGGVSLRVCVELRVALAAAFLRIDTDEPMVAKGGYGEDIPTRPSKSH